MDMFIADLPNHFVFVNATNAGPQFAPMRPETVYAAVRSITRRADGAVPDEWTPHWLRHTHATALLMSGCPPHVVMRRLGHLDVQTTLSVYGWVTEDAELRAVAELGASSRPDRCGGSPAMTRPTSLTALRPDPAWDAIWATVPEPWRTGLVRLDAEPFTEVFVRNTNYLRSVKEYNFQPANLRMAQELLWWLWTIWREGTRKIDPAMLRWWQRAVDTLTTQTRARSIADLQPAMVVREALRQFEKRNGRIPHRGICATSNPSPTPSTNT